MSQRRPCRLGHISFMYQQRFYRDWTRDSDLVSFNATVRETDLYVQARRNLRRKTVRGISKFREVLEGYIEHHPGFLTALKPIEVGEDAPQIVKAMAEAAAVAGVGPMASVAGVMAEYVGYDLLPFSREVIVENGGDIFLKVLEKRVIGLYAGDASPFTGKLALEVRPEETPLGVCTSSGTVGHSLSFGRADACVVLSRSTALADATATAMGNIIASADDIPRGLEFAKGIGGLKGAVIIIDDRIGIWGETRIVSVGE